MPRHDLILPELGLGDRPVAVSLWLVEPGTAVTAGDPVLEVLAGSAVVDLPAPATGVLRETFADEDDPLYVGQRLGTIETGEVERF
jgi:2-oxoglutarate dehydrogenase E2 component (dihydrolipoamide succinyltransferase)